MRGLLIIFLLFVSIPLSAQTNYKIAVVDTNTGYPVSFAGICLLNQKLAINTDEDGFFQLDDIVLESGDSLLITAQGFKPKKSPVSLYKEKRIVEMDSDTGRGIMPVVISAGNKRETVWLNPFDGDKVGAFAGMNKPNEVFNYSQIAQRFELPERGAELKRVKVMRLIWYIDPDPEKKTVSIPNTRVAPERTKFLLRIYDLDSLTGMPGKDLCDSLIEVRSNERKLLRINLGDLNLKIPGKIFFIAVQWLRLPYNECFVEQEPGQQAASQLEDTAYGYKPAIGVSNVKGKMLNTYALTFTNRWVPYAHFAPDYTDFAISAQIEY